MTQEEARAEDGDGEIKRVPSHVAGLDTILSGGFLSGGLYLIEGQAGTGKTVLASQIIYGQAAQGNRALFVTVLGENHGRMMAHLRPMRFFDQSLVPDRVTYISAYQALEEGEDGLKELVALLRREVQTSGATFLVLDGLSAVEAKASSAFAMKRFTHELQTLASATDCTMFLLTTSSSAPFPTVHTMVDGVIELQPRMFGVRAERRLRVQKIRGSAFLEGEHAYRITLDGVTVFPRIEAQFNEPAEREPPAGRLSSGIASLDALLPGGIPAGNMTAVIGPSGAGKTTVGLHFLSASSPAEPGLLFGCYESPVRLRRKAETMGFDLAGAERRGEVELLWHPVGEHILDELAHKLLAAVRRRRVKRLVIDGIVGFQQSSFEQDRIVRFWSALAGELRAMGVTTLQTMELPELMAPDIRVPIGDVSSVAELLIFLRYVEMQSRLFRLISLFKVRDGAFDPAIRQFAITDTGITVGEPFEGVEAVLSGLAREAATRARASRARRGGHGGQPSTGASG